MLSHLSRPARSRRTALVPAVVFAAAAALAIVPSTSASAASSPRAHLAADWQVSQLDPDGNDRLLSRLIALYRDDSSQLLADIDNGMKTGDSEAVARAAHTLKSSSANLGATNVYRALGPGLGIATLVLDMLKGSIPVWVVSALPLAAEFPASQEYRVELAGTHANLGVVLSLMDRPGESVIMK